MADVGDQIPSSDSPTLPFRKVVALPAEESETVTIPRLPTPPPKPTPAPKPTPQPKPSPGPKPAPAPAAAQEQGLRSEQGLRPEPVPEVSPLAPLPPLKQGPLSRIGDVPIKVVYLVGAIVATVLAVVLVFAIFSGDVPKTTPEQVARQAATVSPVPGASASPKATANAIPAPPKSLAYPNQPGTAIVTIGTISDLANSISYPRLGLPWTAKSFAPFSIAQRVGKVAIPHTVIASAMLPGEVPKTKPKKAADYRDLAARAARWTLRTQYPKGATLTWTGSQKVPVGKGWMLGYEVTYTVKGKQRKSEAVISLHEVGETKPAMLYASIPQSGKSHYRDLNTLVNGVRTL